MPLPSPLDRVTFPLVAAPMTGVSGPDLVIAACRAGVVGAFPAHNARSTAQLDEWLERIGAEAGRGVPFAANLIVHRTNRRLPQDLACLIKHRVELVITSVGSPESVTGPLREAGCLVLCDVASLRHADRALAAGADGLVLLTAGAGGQTGWANPFAFVRAVRARFAGPIILAGGIGDGAALWAAKALGADLAYMGTRFIATAESLASPAFRAALVAATLDDVKLSAAPSGLPANFLADWLSSAGHQDGMGRGGFEHGRIAGRTEIWTAGHSVSAVTEVVSVAELVRRTREEYERARSASCSPVGPNPGR